ncbi:MAG TPA: CGNR zinc finger domain-containing protein [Gaiellaceae bacterium]|nr:CGNR zinc finger domain-containing protein [Gaiellaceae bacterium]
MEAVDAIVYDTGRDPAPGRLRLVEGFCNTVDPEHGREMLHSPDALRRVLVGLGLVEDGSPVSDADLADALELRAALRALALANNGVPAPREAEEAVERAAAAGRLGVRFEAGRAELTGTAPAVAGALATLAGIFAAAAADGSWARLKSCRSELCGWLFYDRSRNRSARWCDMAVCGNRTKTRAYRARRA